MSFLPIILGTVVRDLPEIFDAAVKTVETVALEFTDSTNDEKKAKAEEGLCAWYDVADKEFKFSDEKDLFVKEHVIPAIVKMAYHEHKVEIKAKLATAVATGAKPFTDWLASLKAKLNHG